MGRIADALKRAERERRQAPDFSSGAARGALTNQTPVGRAKTPETPFAALEDGACEEKVALVEGLSESLVPFFDRSSLVTEQYRSLRTRLLSQNPNYEHRTIAITSAVPREGKSVTTLNLAAVLAEIRHIKVLVVDGDFRRGSLATMLNQTRAPGLAEALCGSANYSEVIRDTPIPNLKFVQAGETKSRSAAELWTAASASPIFQRMRNDFHYTIIDTPPATTVTDVGIIGQFCSGVIMVIRLHGTDELASKRAVRLLQVNNIAILGCLLIGRDTPSGRYGYGYGYSYYHYYNYYNRKREGE